ncbi:MAG: peptidoglycan recognition family protein [Polyangia bacterium]
MILSACGGGSGPEVALDMAVAVDLAHAPVTDASEAGDASDGSEPAPDLAMAPDFGAGLTIVQSPIAYPATRKSEMATYSKNHYGIETYALEPKQIVLHFTATSTYSSAWNTFEGNTMNRGEYPGTCAQFMVDKDGTIHQLVDEAVRCRHTVGLNHVALGIEMVQETGTGAHWADQQILARPAQIDAVLHLVRWLQHEHGIATTDVLGHAMANQSPYFLDLEGWTNDHTDWQPEDVAVVRTLLDALP